MLKCGWRWPAWAVVVVCALAMACSADESGDQQRGDGLAMAPGPIPGQGGPAGGAAAPGDRLAGIDNPRGTITAPPPAIPDEDSTCARTDINASRVLPSVMLLVDGSQSMTEAYGSAPDAGVMDPAMPAPGAQSRWDAVRTALVDPVDGVVPQLQELVRFGLAVYGTTPTCPLPLGTLDPQTNNFAAIDGALPALPPGLTTPTGVALDQIVDLLPDPKNNLDETIGPQIIILATDGDPNACELNPFAGGMPNYEPSIQAALKAQQKNLRMYVISVGQDAAAAHLQELANLGAGMDRAATPGAEVYYPEDPAGLAATLETLIGDELSCDLALEGKGVKQGKECDGTVKLNGQELECNGPDGWLLADATTITLQGAACESFKNAADALLTANFPCDLLVE